MTTYALAARNLVKVVSAYRHAVMGVNEKRVPGGLPAVQPRRSDRQRDRSRGRDVGGDHSVAPARGDDRRRGSVTTTGVGRAEGSAAVGPSNREPRPAGRSCRCAWQVAHSGVLLRFRWAVGAIFSRIAVWMAYVCTCGFV